MTKESAAIESQLETARQLFTAGQFEQAIELIETTVATHPQQASALVHGAQAFGHCYEIGRAEALLEQALTVVPQSMKPAVALMFQQIFRPQRAVTILEELHSSGALSLPSVAQLAKLYEQSNRRTEATEALQECVDRAPAQPQPKVLLARVYRQRGNQQVATELLESVLAKPAPTATLVHAWSELTLLRDQEGDYDAAVSAMEHAKQILRQLPEVQQQRKRSTAINAAFRQLYELLDGATLQSWSREPVTRLPPAGIAHLLGFPRSGTTLLEQVLDRHPEIHAAPERAVFTKAIFPAMSRHSGLGLSAAALGQVPRQQLDRLRQRYLHCHEEIGGASLQNLIHLDKNPNHTSLLVGLYRLFPESTFLFALRDPRDVIVSTYLRFFSLSEFSASYLSWESTVELYAHEMSVWLKMRTLLPAAWIEVKYEDTVQQLETTAQRVIELLGVPWNPAVMDYRDDVHKFVNSPTHAEVRSPVYATSIGRWHNYTRYLEPYLPRLEPFVKAFGYDV